MAGNRVLSKDTPQAALAAAGTRLHVTWPPANVERTPRESHRLRISQDSTGAGQGRPPSAPGGWPTRSRGHSRGCGVSLSALHDTRAVAPGTPAGFRPGALLPPAAAPLLGAAPLPTRSCRGLPWGTGYSGHLLRGFLAWVSGRREHPPVGPERGTPGAEPEGRGEEPGREREGRRRREEEGRRGGGRREPGSGPACGRDRGAHRWHQGKDGARPRSTVLWARAGRPPGLGRPPSSLPLAAPGAPHWGHLTLGCLGPQHSLSQGQGVGESQRFPCPSTCGPCAGSGRPPVAP